MKADAFHAVALSKRGSAPLRAPGQAFSKRAPIVPGLRGAGNASPGWGLTRKKPWGLVRGRTPPMKDPIADSFEFDFTGEFLFGTGGNVIGDGLQTSSTTDAVGAGRAPRALGMNHC